MSKGGNRIGRSSRQVTQTLGEKDADKTVMLAKEKEMEVMYLSFFCIQHGTLVK